MQITLSGQCFVRTNAHNNHQNPRKKTNPVKEGRQNQKLQSHKFQRITQFKVRLGVIRHRHKGQSQHNLRIETAGGY